MINLANFIAEDELGVQPQNMVDRFSYDAIALKFTELMYGLNNDAPPNQKEFLSYIKAQKDYAASYKQWVESSQFDAIYRRSIEFFA